MISYLLCLLLNQGLRPVELVVSNNRESKIMLEELKIDWSIPNVPKEEITANTKVRLDKLLELQQALNKRLIITNVSTPTFQNRHYLNFKKYPVLLYGERKELEYFPDRAFEYHSWPLLSLNKMILDLEVDIPAWERLCKFKKDAHESVLAYTVLIPWAEKNLPEELKTLREQEWKTAEEMDDESDIAYYFPLTYQDLIDTFSLYDGFPEIPKLELPEQPAGFFPWEKHRPSKEFIKIPVVRTKPLDND